MEDEGGCLLQKDRTERLRCGRVHEKEQGNDVLKRHEDRMSLCLKRGRSIHGRNELFILIQRSICETVSKEDIHSTFCFFVEMMHQFCYYNKGICFESFHQDDFFPFQVTA